MHRREGAIKGHAKHTHDREIPRADLVKNTEILATCNDHRRNRIWILEALMPGGKGVSVYPSVIPRH